VSLSPSAKSYLRLLSKDKSGNVGLWVAVHGRGGVESWLNARLGFTAGFDRGCAAFFAFGKIGAGCGMAEAAP
jgi:hypothetical protein